MTQQQEPINLDAPRTWWLYGKEDGLPTRTTTTLQAALDLGDTWTYGVAWIDRDAAVWVDRLIMSERSVVAYATTAEAALRCAEHRMAARREFDANEATAVDGVREPQDANGAMIDTEGTKRVTL